MRYPRKSPTEIHGCGKLAIISNEQNLFYASANTLTMRLLIWAREKAGSIFLQRKVSEKQLSCLTEVIPITSLVSTNLESVEVGRIEKEIAEALGLNSLPDAIAKKVAEYWAEKRALRYNKMENHIT